MLSKKQRAQEDLRTHIGISRGACNQMILTNVIIKTTNIGSVCFENSISCRVFSSSTEANCAIPTIKWIGAVTPRCADGSVSSRCKEKENSPEMCVRVSKEGVNHGISEKCKNNVTCKWNPKHKFVAQIFVVCPRLPIIPKEVLFHVAPSDGKEDNESKIRHRHSSRKCRAWEHHWQKGSVLIREVEFPGVFDDSWMCVLVRWYSKASYISALSWRGVLFYLPTTYMYR